MILVSQEELQKAELKNIDGKTYMVFGELQNANPVSDWIPVSERLPENAKHKGSFCPKYYVMTEFGQTEGWYNPDVGCWYVLLWFMDARFETWNISLERGDVPKLVKSVHVIAWMPLPKPYEPQESEDKE